MNDINAPVRKAFYTLLNGNLTYGGLNVPVQDEKLKDANSVYNNYVILSEQTSTPDESKQGYERNATINLDIVTKTDNSVSKKIADTIAGQILALIFPTVKAPTIPAHNLPTPANWQFLNVRLESGDRYLPLQESPTSFIMRRILTFGLRVTY